MVGQFSPRDFTLGIATGTLVTLALLSISAVLLFRSQNSLRSLAHWKLNIMTPFPSMWINLGFWKTPDGQPITHFNEATRALLERILDAAGLMARNGDDDDDPKEKSADHALSILDLGFGCGDQTLALTEMLCVQHRPHFHYVGLSLDASQVRTAQRALERRLGAQGGRSLPLPHASFKLFCADAARPQTWSRAVRASVDKLAERSPVRQQQQQQQQQRWMLALDCLYHFSPSRRPAFRLAAGRLGAGLMAFDLLLNGEASRSDVFLVRLVSLIMSCPLYTFVTEDQYRQQLVACGYDAERVEIQDVSDHVFAGVAGCLRRQDVALSEYGIGIGGFKLAGRLFEWFDRTRVVRAVIVVARTKDGGGAGGSREAG